MKRRSLGKHAHACRWLKSAKPLEDHPFDVDSAIFVLHRGEPPSFQGFLYGRTIGNGQLKTQHSTLRTPHGVGDLRQRADPGSGEDTSLPSVDSRRSGHAPWKLRARYFGENKDSDRETETAARSISGLCPVSHTCFLQDHGRAAEREADGSNRRRSRRAHEPGI